jgi:hypothetical protein
MREWKFWDWAGYSALFLAVLFLALVEGVKKMPATSIPGFVDWPIWAFLPLILFVTGTAILFARHMGWLGASSRFPAWPKEYQPTHVVHGKTFAQTTVPLDGHRYVECIFERVTFNYNGTTAMQMKGCVIKDPINFSSDNPAVTGAFILMYALDLFKGDIGVIGLDPTTNTIQKVARKEGSK